MTRGKRTFLSCRLPSLFILASALAVSGCVTTEQELAYLRARSYDRGEIDALNARSECRLMARNLVQIARCDGR